MFIDIHTHHRNQNTFTNNISILNIPPSITFIDNLYSTGLHPWYLNNANINFNYLLETSMQKNCVFIGECGLDKVCKTNWDLQIEYFIKQIKLANEIKKPLIIHCVKASNEIVTILKQQKNSMPIIIHGFNQNKNILDTFLKNNFYISFGNHLLKHNSNAQKAIANVPMQNIFLETDDNKNLLLQHVYTKASEILNINLQTLEHQIENNYKNLLSI